MKKSQRLRDYIIRSNAMAVLFPILMVGLLVVSMILYYNEQDMQQKNHIIASTIAQRITQMLDKPVADLKEIAALLEQQTLEAEKIPAYLQTVVTHADYLEGLEIINEDGRVQYIAPANPNLLGISRVNQGHYQAAKNQEDPFFSTSFISQQTGGPALSVAMKHESSVLVAYLDLEQISMLSAQLSHSYGNDMMVAVTDRRGVYISYKELEKVYQRELDPNVDTIKETLQEKDYYTGRIQGEWVTAYPIENAGWYTIVYQSVDILYDTVKRMVVFSFVILLLFFLMSTSITRRNIRRITRSFQELLAQTREIAKGNYEERVKTDSFEEFNQLADSFNGMVDKIQERDQRLQELAYYDEVTKLPNVSYLKEALRKTLENHREKQKKLAVIYFDLDQFKRINDIYGHGFGDEILAQIGEKMAYLKKDTGLLARMSGDDFVSVLSEMTNPEMVLEEINRIRHIFEYPFSCRETEVYINTSFGIAVYPDHGHTVEALLQHADTAICASKKQGNNRHTFFQESMKFDLMKKMELEKGLRRALENNEMTLNYQPQVFTHPLKTRGIEGLLRWEHPVLGAVSPYEFIPVAEESGLIIPIGEWVISKACEKIASFQESHLRDLVVSVNVSTLQLRSRGFVEMVKQQLKGSGVNPALLELEITESVFIHSFDEAVTILKKLRTLGVKTSLDDFGTGFSSLSYLKNLPINTLKIDKAFVQGMEKDQNTKVMIQSIIAMAHKMDLDVIAEGIETEKQLDRIKSYECDMVQGYFVSRPLSDENLRAYFQKG